MTQNAQRHEREDPFELVLDLRSGHDVLVYGNMMYPWLRDRVRSMEFVRRGSELTGLVRDGVVFDRTIVSRDVDVSNVGLTKLFTMNRGLVCFFVSDDAHHAWLEDFLLHNHPWADVWTFGTSAGPALVTTADVGTCHVEPS